MPVPAGASDRYDLAARLLHRPIEGSTQGGQLVLASNQWRIKPADVGFGAGDGQQAIGGQSLVAAAQSKLGNGVCSHRVAHELEGQRTEQDSPGRAAASSRAAVLTVSPETMA